MADLATQLMRTTARAFYTVDQVLVIDALVIHSTLSDMDLATVLNINAKTLRKHCGRLKEDGLLSIQTRAERRVDQAPSYHGNNPQTGKERLTNRDWYYLNYHRAIDSIKYRMHKLNKHIDSLGMPTTEKKDLSCPRCKSQYTELEVLDNLDNTGQFLCHRCNNPLDPIEEDERANENESMKRLNQQFEKLQQLLQKIDATTVPENDFQAALGKHKPIPRTDANPGARTEIVDVPNKNLQSTKGLVLQPEKIAVQVQDDEDVKRENEAAEAEARKAKEARANALPEWISRSTITQEITAVGAKEEKERREREAHAGVFKEDDGDEKKPSVDNDDVMAAYWKELAAAREKEAQEAREEEEEDDDDEDEFEDVDVSGGGNTPANGGVNGTAATSTGMNTPLNAESSNATDDERESKRVRIEEPSSSNLANGANGQTEKASEDTPAASDADDDELEFQDV